jgi:hypothetical protein
VFYHLGNLQFDSYELRELQPVKSAFNVVAKAARRISELVISLFVVQISESFYACICRISFDDSEIAMSLLEKSNQHVQH